jgi:hypothetical protein
MSHVYPLLLGLIDLALAMLRAFWSTVAPAVS